MRWVGGGAKGGGRRGQVTETNLYYSVLDVLVPVVNRLVVVFFCFCVFVFVVVSRVSCIKPKQRIVLLSSKRKLTARFTQ